MINSDTLLKMQSQRGATKVGVDCVERDVAWVISDCRRVLRENAAKLRGANPAERREKSKMAIAQYVQDKPCRVQGYTDAQGNSDAQKLIEMLNREILDYGILTGAIDDETIYEIRINGKEIKVEKEGKIQDLKDKDGNVLSFTSVEQQETIFRKILGDVRLNPKYAVVNARTEDGYRVAAVHHSALSPDPLNPTGEIYNAMVLRKFRESKLGLNDIVRFGTISDNMAKILSVLAAGGMTFFTVGPTASGKTTLNNAILQAVPATTRTVLLQNPSEIDLRFRDKNTKRVYNDVLHLEAREIEDPSPTDPTMPNLMAHILRLSPTFVCFGELRTNKEFKLGMQIAQAGHPMNATYHAEDAMGAITRYLTAYLAESGNEPAHLALRSLVSVSNIIIVQKILRDGTRKVIQISEIVGVSPTDSNQPLLNDLYRFEIIGEPDYDENGGVSKIHGVHKRVGTLSERTIKKMKLEGVRSDRYDFLCKPVDPNEVETYNADSALGM